MNRWTASVLSLRTISNRNTLIVMACFTCIVAAAGMTGGPSALRTAILSGLLLICTVTDLALRFIPNWLTFSVLPAALGCGWLESVNAGLLATEGFLLSFLITLLLHATMGLGAGDVKLCACLGALLGCWPVLSVLCCAFLFAAVPPILRLQAARMQILLFLVTNDQGRTLQRWLEHTEHWLTELARRQPMAAWLALATLITVSGGSIL